AARDQVAGAAGGTADGVAASVDDVDAGCSVGEDAGAVRPGADGVALDQVAAGHVRAAPVSGGDDPHAVDAAAGNDIAGRRRRAADGVVGRAVEVDAVVRVAKGGGAGGVGTDQVAL